MAAFRECARTPLHRRRDADAPARRYSDKYPFRARSETPDIAIELSLQARGVNRRAQRKRSDVAPFLPSRGAHFDPTA